MSFLGKKWVLQNEEEGELIEKLLQNRKLVSPEERALFFNDGLHQLHDPFLFKDMARAVERIQKVIQKGEKIMIFGDYDVDGVSGTALLYDFLRQIGAKVDYTLPHREQDGYGPKGYFMERFAQEGVKLVLTVDCGTSAFAEITLANTLGMEVIVTDHHSMPQALPPALALLNPQNANDTYPNPHLSGSAVAYKLLTALAPHYLQGSALSETLYRSLGLATLGLIADCMPLRGENRVMVKHGLNSLQHAHHPGIKALLPKATPITSHTVGFTIGPRLNAAGRMDHPDHALKLLLGEVEKGELLHQLNLKRRNLVDQLVAQAKAQVEHLTQVPLVVVVHHSAWPAGVLGLIASQLVETYGKPAIVMQEKGDKLVASCRSLDNFDITQFLRTHAHDLFAALGGHAQAGGFTLPLAKLGELKNRVREFAPNYLELQAGGGFLSIDCLLAPEELNLRQKFQLDRLEPFGQGNPEPLFLLRSAQVLNSRLVGEKQNHLQLELKVKDQTVKGIAFSFGEHASKIRSGQFYEVACRLEINEWNHKKSLQLQVVDMEEIKD